MSVLKLGKIINTKTKAARKFQEERWKQGFGCVECGSIRVWKHRKLKNGLQKYRCQDCHHVFSDQSTTILRWNKRRMDSVAVVEMVPDRSESILTAKLWKHIEEGSTILQPLHSQSFKGIRSSIRQKNPHKHYRGTLGTVETKTASLLQWSITSQHSRLSKRVFLLKKL